MRCPYCHHDETRVVDKRNTQDGQVIRRRRECLRCGLRFTTYEQPAILSMMVVKKDGRREEFDRQKLRASIQVACKKRPVPPERIDSLVARIEQALISRPTREVRSREIGEMVMEGLRELDEVAYIRFASVYREFRAAEDFEKALRQLAPASEET
ncbi:MAG: transcriptional repressor NrdR [Candidatus Poribacteria bacterium]|nr:MAG: transcriptional repressor NrdR [Candidatus Poribacteria bacterium]